jgi:HTH-type transcriptional regulator/antitoxin HigA
MTIHPIESADDLEQALAQVEVLWKKKDKSKKAADELKVLSVLIEDYERRVSPIDPPSPVEAIRFRMDQMGINTARLGELMGTTRSRASEVLSGKRTLSLSMIRALVKNAGLNANVLVLSETPPP